MAEGEGAKAVGPLINDGFWFEYSKKLVEAGSTAPADISDKFQKLVVWLWGLYTGGAALGLSLSDKQLSLTATLLVVAASASLILVYWCAVWIQIPVSVSFDPRSPTQIKNAYVLGTNTKRRRTKITMWVSLLAAALVALSLACAALSPSRNSQAPGLEAMLIKGQDSRRLTLTATNLNPGPEQPTVEVKALSPNKNKDKDQGDDFKALAGSPWTYKPTAKGLVQTCLPVEPAVDQLKIIVSWRDGQGTAHQLSREVKAAE